MPRVVIDNLDPGTAQRLGELADLEGRSLEDEAKRILEHATKRSMKESLEVAAAWREKLGKQRPDSVELLREDRER